MKLEDYQREIRIKYKNTICEPKPALKLYKIKLLISTQSIQICTQNLPVTLQKFIIRILLPRRGWNLMFCTNSKFLRA